MSGHWLYYGPMICSVWKRVPSRKIFFFLWIILFKRLLFGGEYFKYCQIRTSICTTEPAPEIAFVGISAEEGFFFHSCPEIRVWWVYGFSLFTKSIPMETEQLIPEFKRHRFRDTKVLQRAWYKDFIAMIGRWTGL